MKRITFVTWTAMAAVALLGGCGSPFDHGPYAEWIERDPASWQVTQDGATHVNRTLASRLPQAEANALPDDADQDDYVRLALQRNPSIKAAQQRVQRLTERIAQVTSLDDPMFQVAPIGQMAETAAGQVDLMSGVSQKLPFPGKLETRGRIAAQEVAMATQDLHNTRLTVIADTRRAYWTYYYTTRAIEVTGQSRALLAQFRDIARAKYKAGITTQQDVLRASVELSNLTNELITLRQRQTTAIAMLNSLLDRPVTATLPTLKTVELKTISLQLDRLLADAAQANPTLQKIHERIEAFRQRLKLARLQRWPDLTVSLNYNAVDNAGLAPSSTGEDQWWLGFGVNLPIWFGKLEAAEQEALQGIFEGVSDLTNAQNRVAFRVQDASIRVETQQRLTLLFRDVILPQAKQTVDASASGYRAGKVDFLTLVDNWRKQLDFELMYHQSLAQLEQDFADLRQEVGRDLARQPNTNKPNALNIETQLNGQDDLQPAQPEAKP